MCSVHTFVCSAVQLYPKWRDGGLFCRSAGVRIIPNFKLNFKFIDYANNLTPTWKKIVNSLFSFVFLFFPSFSSSFESYLFFYLFFSMFLISSHAHTHTKFLWTIFSFPFSLFFSHLFHTKSWMKNRRNYTNGKIMCFSFHFLWSDRFSISIISHCDGKTMAAGWMCRDVVGIVSRFGICCDWEWNVMARGTDCWLRCKWWKEEGGDETHRTISLHGNNNIQFEDYIKLNFSI